MLRVNNSITYLDPSDLIKGTLPKNSKNISLIYYGYGSNLTWVIVGELAWFILKTGNILFVDPGLNYEKLFEDSYARVIGEGVGIGDKGYTFFTKFYDIFFSKSHQIREKFADVDMDTQVHVLRISMFHMISFYATKTDTEYLANIAHTHSHNQYDIRPEFYDIWMDSLLETVQQSDPEYEDEVALAWQLAMTPGIQFMKFRYKKDTLGFGNTGLP